MRIIGISGVWCDQNPIWKPLREAFTREFPRSEFVVKEEAGCHPWEIWRLRKIVQDICREYDDGTPTLFVGHSMGGIIACAAAQKFRRSRIRGIVTIYSPHVFLGGFFSYALEAVGILPAPVLSFNARRDELVWWGARHPHSAVHITLPSNHFTDLRDDPGLSAIIADITKREFFLLARG
jgi:pimeloyl-ACP methyl ester carboxylesterase